MFRSVLNRVGREYLLIYVLASACDLILLMPQSQLATRAGHQLDVTFPIVFHLLIIGILVAVLSISGALRTRQWSFIVTSILLAVYVGFRMTTRFVASLELVGLLAQQGTSDSGAVPSLYFYGLAAAATYTVMTLTLRRSYGRLVSTRDNLHTPSGPQLLG